MHKGFLKLIAVIIIFGTLFQAKTAFAAAAVTRLAGADRFETAVEISRHGWPEGTFEGKSDYLVLAGAEGSPDPLCSVPLAKKYNAPILITEKDSLYNGVKEEILRLGVKEVFIVGGYSVISQSVEDEVLAMNVKTTRIKGADRYETSVRIAEYLGESGHGVIAEGSDFADVLSIASIAANKGMPLLLTAKNSLPAVVKEYLDSNKISKLYVVGGYNFISPSLYASLSSYNPERLGGENIFETNTIILNRFQELNFRKVYIAAPSNYTDAVTGSVLASKDSSPMILVEKSPPEVTRELVKNKLPSIDKVTVLGGKRALPEDLLNAVLSGFKGNEPVYSLIDESQFEIMEVVTVSNSGNADIHNINLQINLGKASDSPYQKDKGFQTVSWGVSIVDGDDGGKKASAKVDTLKKGQSLEYRILRTFMNGGIKYNIDLSKASANYSSFKNFEKYTSPEDKIESNHPDIVAKTKEIVGDEKNPYMKAKKIFEYVNTTMNYDFSEGNKGALNALTTGKGVSEDFARLFVAMARSAKVPSRVVYGYRMELVDLSKAEDLASYKYAWAEFYLPEYGWIVVEPTEVKSDFDNKRIPAFEYFANLNQSGHFIRGYKSEPGYSITYYAGDGTEPKVDVTIKEYIVKK